MKILNVATEKAKLDMNTQKASLKLHTVAPEIELPQEAARLEISQPKGDLKIDSTAFRASYGIKSMAAFVRENAQEAKSIAMGAIAEIVADGNRLAQIDSSADAVAEMAADSSFPAIGELSWTPLAAPEIHYQANRPKINFVPGSHDIILHRGSVEPTYEPGKVNISVTYPSIRKWVSENKVDLML